MPVRLAKPLFGFILVFLCGFVASANDGYKLWLQYAPIERHEDAHYYQSLLKIQVSEAEWWRDACLLYFQQFAQQPLPTAVERPKEDLAYYMGFKRFFVPGI